MARVTTIDEQPLRKQLKTRFADLRSLLGANTPKARQALRKIVVGKIAMEPVVVDAQRGYKLSGQLSFGRLVPNEVAQLIEPSDCGGPNGKRP